MCFLFLFLFNLPRWIFEPSRERFIYCDLSTEVIGISISVNPFRRPRLNLQLCIK